jgi:hypothetical protein
MFPACAARMVQVPAALIVTVLPLTVHTVVVVDAKVTASPEEAVAFTVNGATPKVELATAPNVIVWLAFAIVKIWLIGCRKIGVAACEANRGAPGDNLTVLPVSIRSSCSTKT